MSTVDVMVQSWVMVVCLLKVSQRPRLEQKPLSQVFLATLPDKEKETLASAKKCSSTFSLIAHWPERVLWYYSNHKFRKHPPGRRGRALVMNPQNNHILCREIERFPLQQHEHE